MTEIEEMNSVASGLTTTLMYGMIVGSLIVALADIVSLMPDQQENSGLITRYFPFFP